VNPGQVSGWLQVIPWGLVIAGWWFVNCTTNFREIRKEARSAIDQAKKDVHAIAKVAIAYFSDPALKNSDEIKNSIELLEVELERLNGYRDSNLAIRFGEFQDGCTGADFESAQRVAHGLTSAVVTGVQYSRNRLIHQLEIQYREQYLHVKWRRVLFARQ